ncbi:hypothetical protein QVD17_41498 [Tagetes erecta]|uniref:Uncharacterized protein n=1 Tax=Tagetes erecta TaxID=13708 RepID=A0AAD8JKQ2_TARER|nr:hypothetical protein QVD17_41498 [Tagetes erecta]
MHGLKLSNMVKNKVGSVEILPRRGTWNNKGDVSRDNGGNFDSAKVEKTSVATTNGIHASNTVHSYADMAKKIGVDSDNLGTKHNFRYMVNVESKQGFDVVLPKDSIRAVCNKLEF